jgi:hypothetical protein
MTPRQENSIERSVGRIEARQETMAENIKALTDAVMGMKDASDEWRHEVKARLEAIEARDVSSAFIALQQSIRDGKMQIKGAFIGVALAGGAAGATVATFIKAIAAWIAGIWA